MVPSKHIQSIQQETIEAAKNNFMSPPASDQLGVFDENQNVVDF